MAVEPDARGHARHGVLLDAELRQEEGVDDVLGAERRDDRAPDREVELIQGDDVVGRLELAVRPRVPDVPGETAPR